MSPPTVSFNHEQLTGLAMSLFSVDELRRLCGYWPAGRPLGQDIALYGGHADIATLVVQEVVRQELVDLFFLVLQERRPLRRDEVDAVQRRWWVHRQAEVGSPPSPLALSAEMERIQLFAEGDDSLVHRETTGLHLLYAVLAVPLGYEAQSRLCRLIPPANVLRALKALARVAAAEIPEGMRVVRQGYERLWVHADELARRRGGDMLQYPDMLTAMCMLRPGAVGEYLQMIEVTWETFERTALRGAAVAMPPEEREAPRAVTMELPEPPEDDELPPPQRLVHYHEVYAQFVDLKRAVGEELESYTLERFVRALHAKTTALMQQADVVEVRFAPYVKDGKVALRANFRRREGQLPD